MRTVYVVLALTLDVPPATTHEEIDDILNEATFDVKSPVVKDVMVAENQFSYEG